MRAGDGTRTHDVQLGKLAFYGMGNSIGVVEVWRGSARRARRLRAVHAGSVARPSAACLCRGPAGPARGDGQDPQGAGSGAGLAFGRRRGRRATDAPVAGGLRAPVRAPAAPAAARLRRGVRICGLRDARHDPHRAGAVRAHQRVDLEELPQQRRPPARRLGGRQARRDDHRHGGIGTGGCRPAPHPARAVGIPPVVPRGDLPLVGDVGEHAREELQGLDGLVTAVGPSALSER